MNAKIYQGAADTALGSLTEMDNVRDVTLTMEAGEADVTTRANSGWRATAATLKECSAEFEMIWQPGDAGFEAVKDAFIDSTSLSLAVLSGDKDTSDTEGVHGNFTITNFTRNEPLEEGVTVSVTAKLSSYTAWVSVA